MTLIQDCWSNLKNDPRNNHISIFLLHAIESMSEKKAEEYIHIAEDVS